MADTGGPLNELNGKMGISAPFKSVAVMKLIKVHSPKSKEELVELIKSHYENKCECGIVSQGTVESFGHNLYNAQMAYWKEIRFSLQECLQWEYNLFVVNSLQGGIIEKRAIKEFNTVLTDYTFEEAEGYLDEEFRIDILIKKKGVEAGGVQVKPLTYKLMRREVITFNTNANQKWGKPVFYLYYNGKDEFVNLEKLIEEIRKL